jgi:hypothetical protein
MEHRNESAGLYPRRTTHTSGFTPESIDRFAPQAGVTAHR